MSNSKNPELKYNESSCADGTAYLAVHNLQREERRRLITELKNLANKHGYKITSKIVLEEIGGERK